MFNAKRPLDYGLVALVVVGVALMVLANEDPVARDALCRHSGFCPWSAHAAAVNKFLYDAGLTGLMSLVFYWLLVRAPENTKRRRLRRSLEQQYRIFKQDCIGTMLGVVEGTYPYDLTKELVDQDRFRDYFEQRVSDSQDRWHVLENNLEEHHLRDLLTAMRVFRDEVLYALNNTDIDDDDSFEFFKRLSRAIYVIQDAELGYEESKPLFRFLWELFAGWSWVEGYRKEDIVAKMIKAI